MWKTTWMVSLRRYSLASRASTIAHDANALPVPPDMYLIHFRPRPVRRRRRRPCRRIGGQPRCALQHFYSRQEHDVHIPPGPVQKSRRARSRDEDVAKANLAFQVVVFLCKKVGDTMREVDPNPAQQLTTEADLPMIMQEDTRNHLHVLRSVKDCAGPDRVSAQQQPYVLLLSYAKRSATRCAKLTRCQRSTSSRRWTCRRACRRTPGTACMCAVP